MVAVAEIFSQEIEHQIRVNFILVILGFVHRKDETPSVLVVGVLPLGLDARLEVLERVDASQSVIYHESEWWKGYARCLLLPWSKKLSRVLSCPSFQRKARSAGVLML